MLRYFTSRGTGRIALTTLTLTGVLISCEKRLEGTYDENRAPEVWFVNVPTENSVFQTNPIINWEAKDIDGQVMEFRYAVIREDSIANRLGLPMPLDSGDISSFILTRLTTYPDSTWRVLEVDPTSGQPQTSNIIQLTAELTRPVTTKVPQFVFLQAFDDKGKSSRVIFRRFLRIDNPPNTQITNFNRQEPQTYINARSAAQFTGIRMSWRGTDPIDYPADPPPFEFEWRLYGPYTYKTPGSTEPAGEFDQIMSNFLRVVFVTTDGQVFRRGEGEIYTRCDTTPTDTTPVITCITIDIDTVSANNAYGSIDTMLAVEDPAFQSNPDFNRVAAESDDGVDQWVTDTNDSVYNVFASRPADTTRDARFFFWVRSRDDALVPDLTPAFVTFYVVDAQYERDIGIINMQKGSSVNGVNFPTRMDSTNAAREYWNQAIPAFAAQMGYPDLTWDVAIDYIQPNVPQGFSLTLKQLLSYKTLILFSDDTQSSQITSPIPLNLLPRAILGGVNMWIMMRAPFEGSAGGAPIGVFDREGAPILCDSKFPGCSFYFGAISMVYSGWDYWVRRAVPPIRIEDFIGARSSNIAGWPNLEVDTLLLENRYNWRTNPLYFRYPASYPVVELRGKMVTGALPEVDWTVRDFRSELMYEYRSLYAPAEHPLGVTHTFEGNPVAFRLNRGAFRTAFWNFTPYSIKSDQAQQAVNAMLQYLYGPKVQHLAPGNESRSTAQHPISDAELRERYRKLYETGSGNFEPITYQVGSYLD